MSETLRHHPPPDIRESDGKIRDQNCKMRVRMERGLGMLGVTLLINYHTFGCSGLVGALRNVFLS
jgi:hypothetical protein